MSAAELDLEIDSIAGGGDGVARTEGMVVFVPRTAPGDRVRAAVTARGRFGRGRLTHVIRPSAERIEPPCPHYTADRCGGCQLQHLRYPAQLDAKRIIIGDALTRIARRDSAPPSVEASPREWRYRTKLTLTMRRRAGTWMIGLRPYDDPSGLFELRDCPITDERVLAVWQQIREAKAFYPDVDELRGSVQIGPDGSAAVVMMGAHQWPKRREFFEAIPSASALWWQAINRPRMLVARRSGDDDASASFAQINPAVASTLQAHVIERAQRHSPSTVVDAYAGSGATAIPLARGGARVYAIELDRNAAERCAAALPPGSTSQVGRVEDHLAGALPADVVLLNPPRVGVHEQVTTALRELTVAPKSVIYVSCDAATLARDLARLPDYRIASLRAFDMFPQTAHVETVCELVPTLETA